MKTENTKKIAESIVISRKKLIEKIIDGWPEEEQRGFHTAVAIARDWLSKQKIENHENRHDA